MIERFLKQTKFTSEQDFKEHLEFIIPEDFNFAYDVMDEWAKIKPDHVALLWASERGEEIRFTYKDLKEQSDKAAAYLSLTIFSLHSTRYCFFAAVLLK